MNDEVFSVYGALDALNKRVKALEGNMPDYIVDMYQLQKAIGALTNRVIELERKLEVTGEIKKGA